MLLCRIMGLAHVVTNQFSAAPPPPINLQEILHTANACHLLSARVCVCVFPLVMFVQRSALTVEPSRPFVNHTLLRIGVFNSGVIVGYKVRLWKGQKRTREKNCEYT